MHVEPREGESFDQFLRRFKTSMDKSGILREYKRKRYFKSNGELQREKAKAAARRRTKRFRGPRPARPTCWVKEPPLKREGVPALFTFACRWSVSGSVRWWCL